MSTLKIVQGEDRVLNLHLTEEDSGADYNLTGATEITVKFKNADLSVLTRTYTASGGVTIVSAVAGKIEIALTDAQTALLYVGEGSIYCTVEFGSTKRIITEGLENSIEVVETPF